MGDANGGIGFVDMLSARAGSAIGINAQIGGIDGNRFHVFAFRENGNGSGAGVNASAAFRFRHALHAVRARFKFERGIDVFATDAADDFFIAAVFAGIFRKDFQLPAFVLRVFVIHAKEIAGKNRRFIAARTGANFQIDVGFIQRIFGNHQAFQRFFARRARFKQTRPFFAGQLRHLGIVFEQFQFANIAIKLLQLLIMADNRAKLGKFLPVLAQ